MKLIAKGFTQEEVIDYSVVFSLLVRHTSIRILLSLVVQFGLELEQIDVTTGTLDENRYMKQPPGYEEIGKENMVRHLQKSIYGF